MRGLWGGCIGVGALVQVLGCGQTRPNQGAEGSDRPNLASETTWAEAVPAPERPQFQPMGASDGVRERWTGWQPAPVDLSHLTTGRLARVQKHILADATTTPPSKYDLRTQGRVTPVRDQGRCGSCWTFGTYASLESFLLPTETVDYSENNLKNRHGFDWGPCAGGNSAMSVAYLTRGGGPVDETADPYGDTSATSPDGLPVQKTVTDVAFLPDRIGSLDNDAIKRSVMAHGAVVTAMCMHQDTTSFSVDEKSYYYNRASCEISNGHTVAIVGWDDDYPAKNFAVAPPGNGAFLIKNSWGTHFGDQGYFYISYYDTQIAQDGIAFERVESPNPDRHVYQYDPLGMTGTLGSSQTSETAWFANVFTAFADDEIDTVAFYALSDQSAYELSVYTDLGYGPIGAAKTATQSGTLVTAGYHTLPVTVPVSVPSGRSFSVVVKITTPGYRYPIPVERPLSNYSSQATAAAGQSYISFDGTIWKDLTVSFPNTNVALKAFSANCEDGNVCTDDRWNGVSCVHSPRPAGTVCRASAGPCDVAESCDGLGAPCPPDTLAPASTECRPSAGPCDVTEKCGGVSAMCPPDQFAPAGQSCRASGGPCDLAEVCTGTQADCPADRFAALGTVCRAAGGACDIAETCSGTCAECPTDSFAAAGTVCRVKAGPCDVAEQCTGGGPACPVDGFVPSGTVCRAANGMCDEAEMCSGSDAACPADAFKSPGTICRAATCAQGVATVQAECTGTLATCPEEQPQPCDPFSCNDTMTACRGDCSVDSQCATPDFCAAGVCRPKRSSGSSCGSDSQCASDHCADSVCCDTACKGQCEACNTDGSMGKCSPVTGSPRSGRASCASDGTVCAGACDGVHSTACQYPGAGTRCRTSSCTESLLTLEAFCSGTGRCPAVQQETCSPLACVNGACVGGTGQGALDALDAGEEQCSSGFGCGASGECVPDAAAVPSGFLPATEAGTAGGGPLRDDGDPAARGTGGHETRDEGGGGGQPAGAGDRPNEQAAAGGGAGIQAAQTDPDTQPGAAGQMASNDRAPTTDGAPVTGVGTEPATGVGTEPAGNAQPKAGCSCRFGSAPPGSREGFGLVLALAAVARRRVQRKVAR